MLKWLYIANAILSFLIFIYYFETTKNKVNAKQILLLVFTSFASTSYALTTAAPTVEAAILGNIVYYISIAQALVMMMLIIVELCGYNAGRFFRLFLFSYAGLIIFLVSSTGMSGLYYKEITLQKLHGAGYLTKVYGSFHILFPILVIGINLSSCIIVSYTHCTKKSLSRHVTHMVLLVLFACSALYMLPRFLGCNLEFNPFAFTIMDIVLIHLYRRASLYDMSSNLLNTFEQRNEYGYISFDRRQRYMGCNSFALKLFPELAEIRLDSRVPPEFERIHKELLADIEEFDRGKHHEHIFHSGEISVICTIAHIMSVKKIVGYLFELRDITEQQNYAERLEKEVTLKTQKITEIQDSIITGMAGMVESRDNSTGGHIRRTSAGVRVFVEGLKKSGKYTLDETFCKNMIKAAPMHDLGKIAVDDAVLRKPGKFEPEEYEMMKKHSAEGARIVKEVLKNVDDEEFKSIAVNVAHYHHEKWNGTGYPVGLKEKEIPLEARIMAFADVFDALVSKRCYKDAFTYDRAFEIIKNDSGTHFDPELSEVFLGCRKELEKLYSGLEE